MEGRRHCVPGHIGPQADPTSGSRPGCTALPGSSCSWRRDSTEAAGHDGVWCSSIFKADGRCFPEVTFLMRSRLPREWFLCRLLHSSPRQFKHVSYVKNNKLLLACSCDTSCCMIPEILERKSWLSHLRRRRSNLESFQLQIDSIELVFYSFLVFRYTESRVKYSQWYI